MLDFTVSQNPFRFGLQEGIEPHQVTPGTLLTAENVAWSKSGKLGKRFGVDATTTSLVGGGNLTAGSRLFTRGSELCLVDGTNLYAYSSTLASWRTIGRVPNVGITSAIVADPTGGAAIAESAVSASGLRVDAWVTGAGLTTSTALYVQVTDLASGTVVLAPTAAFASTLDCVGVRVLIIGTTAIVLTLANASKIAAVTVSLTTLAVSAVTNLRSDSIAIGGSQGFDACVIGANFVICYTATGTLLKLYSYNTSLVQQATGGITSEASGAHVVSIDGASGEVLYVLYSQGVANPSPVKVAIANSSTLAQTVAPATVELPAVSFNTTQVGVCRYDSSSSVVAYYMQDAAGVRVTSTRVTSAGAVSALVTRGTYATRMASKPFMLGSQCLMALVDTTSLSAISDRSTILVEVEVSSAVGLFDPHRYIGLIDILVGGAGVVGGQYAPVPTASVASATAAYLAVGVQSSTNAAAVRQGVRVAKMATGASAPLDMWRSVSVGSEAFVTGGILSAYDGRTAFDYGFPRGPVMRSLTPSNSAGSIALGVYQYGATLEYRSATGLLYRSPTQTTNGTATIAGANNTVTVVVASFNIGNKQTVGTLFGSSAALPTILPWYRTTVNGTNYQRLTIDPVYNTTLVNQSLGNATFVDRSSDIGVGGTSVTLASRPLLYTAGGILDDFPPVGGVTLNYHVDRLWVLANDQRSWWYSKAFQDDLGTAPGFHPNFRIVFADAQTAMASMDDKAIFFSATGVKYMLGTGPAPNGQNSDFQTPTTIQSDVGCINARSVVTTPDGVMFLSDRGLYLLDRGLTLSWIGRSVKDTIAAYPIVTSATLVAKQNQVRFTCNAADGSSGIVLVYDYVEKQWSTFRHWSSGSYGTAYADACLYNGQWAFVTSAGVVSIESTTSYLDSGNYVPMTLETAWITAGGPLAFQSVREFALHGYSNTDHDLTVQVGFDTDPSYPQSITFPATSPVTAVGSLDDCVVSIGTRRKCNAIRFRISDATPSAGVLGTGQGPSFDMMALEVGVKRGTGNTPATKRG